MGSSDDPRVAPLIDHRYNTLDSDRKKFAEARAFFGLPDIKPMQDRIMGEIEERLLQVIRKAVVIEILGQRAERRGHRQGRRQQNSGGAQPARHRGRLVIFWTMACVQAMAAGTPASTQSTAAADAAS